MRPKPVGHFCRIVLICCWLGFASLSKAGEIVRCYLSLVLCIASRRFSSLSSCQNGWFKVGTCNACSGICANLRGSYSQRVVVQCFFSRAMAAQGLVLFARFVYSCWQVAGLALCNASAEFLALVFSAAPSFTGSSPESL